MPLTRLSPPPERLRPPPATYSHGTVVPPGQRLVVLSGQLGIAPDGTIPAGIEAQTAQVFDNLAVLLAEAGLDFAAVVRLNAYVTDRAYLEGYMAVRDRHVSTPPPASTLMIVQGFARPEFKVEVELIAAGPDGG